MGSWLEGPQFHHGEDSWPGKRLGLAESGPNSRAGLGRRFLALAIDWALCMALSAFFFDYAAWAILVFFVLENIVLVSTLGSTIGHRVCGIGVRRLDGRVPGFASGIVRSVLVALVVPAVVYDRDHRGGHDLAARTVIVRL